MIKESKLIGTKLSMPYGWHEFKVGDLFDKIVTNSDWIDDVVKISDVKNRPYNYVDGISATTSNNQRSMYVKVNNPDAILHNKLSSTANADGMMFYQPTDFVVVQDAYALELKNNDYANDKNVLLFLQGAQKRNMAKYNYSLKSGWARVKEDVVILPVTQDGQPDYGWMSSYICELENQRIRELDTYLQVTGLDDTTLTDDELQVLEQWRQHEKFGGGTLLTKHFAPLELFDFPMAKSLNKDDLIVKQNGSPYVTRTVENNGVNMLIDLATVPAEYVNKGNEFSFGLLGLEAFYQKHPYVAGQFVRRFIPKFAMNETLAMYFKTLIDKLKPELQTTSIKGYVDVLANPLWELPVTNDGTPDYDFMQTFIRAQEKLVMQRLDKFRQLQIDTTRQII